MNSPQVFVVDDDISGWQAQTFASAEEFLATSRAVVPSCLVLDYRLPQLDGLRLQQRLLAQAGHMPVIFITCYGDPPMAVQAMKAGALEVLSKPFREDALLDAIQEGLARSHTTLLRQEEARRLQQRYAALSRREREVMWLVVAGRLNKQIAATLGISEITVKAHRGRVMRKMKAGSLAELVGMTIRLDV